MSNFRGEVLPAEVDGHVPANLQNAHSRLLKRLEFLLNNASTLFKKRDLVSEKKPSIYS